ncbi:hypothetical protein [Arthrobacter sp. STN4]|uniref:hypothetical protein n=1 Tax=Arthrobacter sp. STN4 TaxID=2923276 RepID=UPI002119EC91|nr:hypothetical protein [Arthrobacter sp. STN4]MCQ9163609.1 hypothetical protein [Arthrobacter sp. STN4]
MEVLRQRYELMVPAEVDVEVARMKGNRGPQADFSNVSANWKKLTGNGHVAILDSSMGTPGYEVLDREVRRLTGLAMEERKLNPRDLGEIMAVAHAVVLRRQGREAILLIEDGMGQQLAADNSIKIIDTVQVLRLAAYMGKIGNRAEMSKLYARMQPLDSALLPVAQTGLLDKDHWRKIEAFKSRKQP